MVIYPVWSILYPMEQILWRTSGDPESIKESGVRESQECGGISFPSYRITAAAATNPADRDMIFRKIEGFSGGLCKCPGAIYICVWTGANGGVINYTIFEKEGGISIRNMEYNKYMLYVEN